MFKKGQKQDRAVALRSLAPNFKALLQSAADCEGVHLIRAYHSNPKEREAIMWVWMRAGWGRCMSCVAGFIVWILRCVGC
jgi:hypothetical protein